MSEKVSRRKILSYLGLGGPALGMLALLPRLTEVRASDLKKQLREVTVSIKYRDFKITWTGWKKNLQTNSEFQIGQWLAFGQISKDPEVQDVYIYSSVTGASGRYYPGQIFDISVRPWQKLIDCFTSEEEKEFERTKAYEILLMEIDRFHQPLKSFFRYRGKGPNGETINRLLESEVSVQESLNQAVKDTPIGDLPYLFYKG